MSFTRSRPLPVLTIASAALALLVSMSMASPASAEDALFVRELLLARNVLDREPVEPTDQFGATDPRAYAFARIENTGEPTTVTFVWYRDETFHGVATLTVGTSPGWRTWSSAELSPGAWRIEIADSAGKVLAGRQFFVE